MGTDPFVRDEKKENLLDHRLDQAGFCFMQPPVQKGSVPIGASVRIAQALLLALG